MPRKLGIKLIAAGTIIGANVSAYPITHVNAEEITISENSAELQLLTIDEFQLDQTFSHDVKAYTASVSNDIKAMNLVVEKKEEAAAIMINGEAIDSGAKTSLPLSTGNNEFVITVTNGTAVSTYSITVDREKNDNNQLSNLSLSNGSFTFDTEKTDYEIEVKNEVSNITIKPKVAADMSTININGTSVKNGEGHAIDIPVGSSTIKIIVTAENGNKKTYTLTVVRDAEQSTSSNNVEEEKEQVEEGAEGENEQVEEGIEEDQTTSGTSSKTTKPDFSSETTITNNSGTKSAANAELLSPSSSNSSNSLTKLASSSETSASEAATTANLDSLTVSSGTWNKSFSSDSYTYHISVANDVTSLTISAEAEESDAEILIEDKEISSNSTVTIEDKAKTAISIVVEHDEDRKTYVLIVDKDIEEEVTTEAEETSDNVEAETTTVTSETEDVGNRQGTTESNQMNGRAERQTETPSFWQKLLSFFGL